MALCQTSSRQGATGNDMKILADHNIEGHAAMLWDTLSAEGWGR